MHNNRYQPSTILAFLLICVIWGTTYYAILEGLHAGLTPFVMGTLRFLIAGICLLIIAAFNKELSFQPALIGRNLLTGAVMMGGGQGLIFWVEQHINSGYAAVLGSSLPLWFVLMDTSNRAQYLQNKKIITGLALGFAGIVLLFYTQFSNSSHSDGWMSLLGGIAMLISCVCWVWGSLVFKQQSGNLPMLNSLPWQVFGGMLSCILVACFTGEWLQFRWSMISTQAWWALAYLAVVSSVIAFVTYQWLLRQWPAAIVGTYAYITPVVALLVGYFAANERVSLVQLIGVATIVTAAFTVNQGRQQMDQTNQPG